MSRDDQPRTAHDREQPCGGQAVRRSTGARQSPPDSRGNRFDNGTQLVTQHARSIAAAQALP